MRKSLLLLRNQRWYLLCWGAALVLGLNWIVQISVHPKPSLLFPAGSPDTLLYTLLIHRASEGFTGGDPFIWEYRHDPSSIFSFLHFWPVIYGFFYGAGGEPLLLAISILLSGLWFYSVFSFCLKLGQARPYAFFVAGVQTFFVVNQAYEVAGFRTSFTNYNFWWTEHSRLYPTVTAMAFYNFCAIRILRALESHGMRTAALSAALVALIAYGRPFDWMVVLGALGVLIGLALALKHRRVARRAFALLSMALLFSSVFVFQYLKYQHRHHAAYFDQIIRGSLQVKLPSHYAKYAVLCVVLLGAAMLAYRRFLKNPLPGANQESVPGEVTALTWLLSLAASSLLVHFKTALEGGLTLAGFTYLFVFSMVPWFFMLGAHFFWSRWGTRRLRLFQSPVWVAALFGLLLAQQTGMAARRFPDKFEIENEESHRFLFSKIRDSRIADPVVLTTEAGLEGAFLADLWYFSPPCLAGTYLCSAPTTELLERILLTKLLLTGTLKDLEPLFSEHGLADIRGWLSRQGPQIQFWAARLEYGVGANTYIFDPIKNRGELRLRNIRLPETLAMTRRPVAYFAPELREVFFKCKNSLESTPASVVLDTILRNQRLDYIYVFQENVPHVNVRRLRDCRRLHEIPMASAGGGRLWRVDR